ncbi:MAG: alpha/beta hydrolase [Gammaproteobacteria bacterium]
MSDALLAQVSTACRDFEQFEIPTRDGSRLTAWEIGPPGAPSVAVVNPVGVPILISSRLCRALGERYRVTCWEQRGYSMSAAQFHSTPHYYGSFANDVADVVAARHRGKLAGLVGICSGAALAITAASRGLVRSSSVILVCPVARFRDGYVPSIFDSAFIPYMRMISAGNQPLARELLDMRAAYAREPRAAVLGVDQQLIETADTISLKSLDGLLVYARTIQTFADEMLDEDIAGLRQKTFVFGATDDRTVSIHSIRKLCRRLPDAWLYEYATGGHHSVFSNAEMREKICEVIDTRPRGGP